MALLPFSIRRYWLLATGAAVDRDHPDLKGLATVVEPEKFVWAILPHAARSFAPSILLLPEREARAAAVGYLYARMLDTYEDLSVSSEDARRALHDFSLRFDSPVPGHAPEMEGPQVADQRDRVHVLLIERCALVDEMFMTLDPAAKERIVRLVQEMAEGMIEFAAIFATQNGVLDSEAQVIEYCHTVIGVPVLFMIETVLGQAAEEHETDALEVSELIQLANITRDVEKDLVRGVAYHPLLRSHLG